MAAMVEEPKSEGPADSSKEEATDSDQEADALSAFPEAFSDAAGHRHHNTQERAKREEGAEASERQSADALSAFPDLNTPSLTLLDKLLQKTRTLSKRLL